jgi:hypothetical protein
MHPCLLSAPRDMVCLLAQTTDLGCSKACALGMSPRAPLATPHLRALLLRAHGVGAADTGLRSVAAAGGHAGAAAAAAAHRERVHIAVAVHAHLRHGAAGK